MEIGGKLGTREIAQWVTMLTVKAQGPEFK